MSGGLIPANLRRQVTALGPGEPADRAVAKVVERESVLELETEPLTIVGKSRGPGHIPRNEERLLHRHQPATPLIQYIAININAKNVRAPHWTTPRTLQSPRRSLNGCSSWHLRRDLQPSAASAPRRRPGARCFHNGGGNAARTPAAERDQLQMATGLARWAGGVRADPSAWHRAIGHANGRAAKPAKCAEPGASGEGYGQARTRARDVRGLLIRGFGVQVPGGAPVLGFPPFSRADFCTCRVALANAWHPRNRAIPSSRP